MVARRTKSNSTEEEWKKHRKERRERGHALLDDTEELVDLMPEESKSRRASKRQVPKGGIRGRENDPRTKIKISLGKRWSEIFIQIERGLLTWEEFVEGLDPDELVRGQLRDKRGNFQGRPPKVVPREFHLACQRELRRRFNEKMQGRLLAATDQYIRLSKKTKDEKLKEQMLRYIMERVMGPVPKTVELSSAPKHEGFLAAVIRGDGVRDYSGRYDRRTTEDDDDDE